MEASGRLPPPARLRGRVEHCAGGAVDLKQPDWGYFAVGWAIIAFGWLLMSEADAGSVLVLLGLLMLLFSLRPSVASIPVVDRGLRHLRRRRAQRKAERQWALCRAQHGREIAVWEEFYDAGVTALHYVFEVREERLPLALAWPWFLYHLPRAVRAGEALPEPLRTRALALLAKIEGAVEETGGAAPASRDNSLTGACYALRDWMSDRRIKQFLPLYGRCGLSEPFWPTRIKTLSPAELESTPAPTLPAGQPPPTAPSPTPPSSRESSG